MSLFNLAAKITLDSKQYESGMQDAKKSLKEYRSDVMKLAHQYKKSGMEMKEAMAKAYKDIDKSQYDLANHSKKASKTFFGNWKGEGEGFSAWAFAKGQLIADGIKMVTKAVIGLGKAAVESYANAEQLIGGVETLFKHSSNAVLDYAKNAYKTTGMSANEYMETVTGFSASLIQSLGGDTERAAKYADMALVDMSDNANKMGTNMESIKYAYQGLAKQNYTMLDNLKLGYGGTKEEMNRLLKDAHRIDKSIGLDGSFGNIVRAIHVIQERMGIAGTTSKEAADTISGSAGAVKAAWENLLTGIADKNADFSTLVNNFVESVKVSAENIVPKIKTAVKGIIKTFSELLPEVIEIGTDIIVNLAFGIVEAIPDLIPALIKVMAKIVETLITKVDDIFYFTAELAAALIVGLGKVGEQTINFIKKFFGIGVEIVKSIGKGIADTWNKFIEFVLDLFEQLTYSIIYLIADITIIGLKIVENIKEGIKRAWEGFKKWVIDLWNAFVKEVSDTVTGIKEIGKQIVENIKEGIQEAWTNLKNWFSNLWSSLFGTGNMNVNINTNGKPADGSHANGLAYVPKDGYRAILHKGERVLTAEENRRYSSNTSGGVTIVQNISAVPQTAAELAAASRVYLEGVRFA